MPSAAGGSAKDAKAHFDRARQLAPAYKLTAVVEAQSYAVLTQDRKLFEARLGEALSFSEGSVPDLAPENRLAKKLARELLGRRDRLF